MDVQSLRGVYPAIVTPFTVDDRLDEALNRFLEYDPGYVAPCKEAMEMLGIKVGLPRKPMPGLTDAERSGVRAALKELGLL